MRPHCRMKEKINNLNLNEGLKKQLCYLMLNSSDSEESQNEVAVLEDEELFISTTKASSFNSNEECTCKLNLCVITKEETLILDLINRLEEPLEKVLKLLSSTV